MGQDQYTSHGMTTFGDLEEALAAIESERSLTGLQDGTVFGQQFGRMFPDLPPAAHDVAFLEALGAKGGPMDEGTADRTVGDSSLPAGNAFLGQFIDHTITLEVRSELLEKTESDELRNFRTPRFDLDSVYGANPEVDNYLYQQEGSPRDTAKLLVGVDEQGNEIDDLQRNHDGIAIIGDPRNDENAIISQMQLAFIRFHNRVVDALAEAGVDESELLDRAQKLVRRHFQWVVVNQFLPRVCETDTLEDVLQNGRQYFTVDEPEDIYLPLEFAGAAYRYGHSQIRETYSVNDRTADDPQRFYGPPDEALGTGFQPVRPEDTVEWQFFFEFEGEPSPQPARKIDPLVRPVLLELPFIEGEFTSLATRNLLRGYTLRLPSGQAVAETLGRDPLTNHELGLAEAIETIYADLDKPRPETVEAPLWYYVLGEAHYEHDGETLGPVGSRIVAETIVGLLEADPASYRNQPDWQPTLAVPATGTHEGEFRMQDILADGPVRLVAERE